MKVTILYFTSSGNTARIADLLADHIRRSGHQVLLTALDEAQPSDLSGVDLLLVGSPAWSGERVVQPIEEFLTAHLDRLHGQRIAFFGSYDWGEGRYFEHLISHLRGEGLDVHGQPLLFRVGDAEPQSDDAREFMGEVLGVGGLPG
jgi:flavodoxin